MARHLHLVNATTGEAEDACSGCQALLEKVSALKAENTRLKNAEEERLGLAPDAGRIMEVLTFHKRLLSPRWKIVRGKAAWKAVKERLADMDGETNLPAFTVLHLKAASVGVSMDEWNRREKLTSAAWLFAEPDRVQRYIDNSVCFKREFGTSALEIVDRLGRGGFERLADLCDCGHIRLEHEKERPELELWDPPCGVHGCTCPGWQSAPLWEQLKWAAERDREMLGA
jgi:hypothetical protein